MADSEIPSPEDTDVSGDPGAETASRYRFQWTWAAVVCCMLLDETEDVQEVFCEKNEDVLLKHRDGLFTGDQVKTRNDDQPPWKAKDAAVIAACERFAKLESEYPGRFRGYRFLTNHPLHSAGNGQDLTFVLSSIRNAPSVADLPSIVVQWINRVAQGANVSEEVAFSALSKTVASADLPKLRDARMRLMDTLAQCWAPAADCSHDALGRAAQALIDECGRASCLDHQQLLPAYVIATVDQAAATAERIDGKRMTLARVQRILEDGRDSTATLAGDPTHFVEPGEGSIQLLRRKLNAGGFSAVSRNSAETLLSSAVYLAIVWIKKHGHDKGLERYNHMLTLVLSDAGKAFDATQTEVDGFGPAMREHLCRRFHERRVAGDQLYDSTDDHLEGFVFLQTAHCKVVWSHAKPWESQ